MIKVLVFLSIFISSLVYAQNTITLAHWKCCLCEAIWFTCLDDKDDKPPNNIICTESTVKGFHLWVIQKIETEIIHDKGCKID